MAQKRIKHNSRGDQTTIIEAEIINADGTTTKADPTEARGRAEYGITKRISERTMESLGARCLTNTVIHDYLGLSERQFYEMLRMRPELRIALNRGRAKVKLKIANVFITAALNGNVFAANRILSLKHGFAGDMLSPYYNPADDTDPELAALADQQGATGGVVILPADVADFADWENRVKAHHERIAASARGDAPAADVAPAATGTEGMGSAAG